MGWVERGQKQKKKMERSDDVGRAERALKYGAENYRFLFPRKAWQDDVSVSGE